MDEQMHGTDDLAAIRAGGVINPPTESSPPRDLPESSDERDGDENRMLADDESASTNDDSLDGSLLDDEETEYDIEAQAD